MNAELRESIALAAAVDTARHLNEMLKQNTAPEETQELNNNTDECDADSDYNWLT